MINLPIICLGYETHVQGDTAHKLILATKAHDSDFHRRRWFRMQYTPDKLLLGTDVWSQNERECVYSKFRLARWILLLQVSQGVLEFTAVPLRQMLVTRGCGDGLQPRHGKSPKGGMTTVRFTMGVEKCRWVLVLETLTPRLGSSALPSSSSD